MNFRKHAVFVFITAVMIGLIPGCAGPGPLKLSHYSRNVIIKADKGVYVNGESLDLKNLRGGLVKHMIFEQTPLVLHVEHTVLPEFYDSVVMKLRAEGYKNLEARVYKE
jgi:biopolymer transport protein ExbD